MSVSIATSISEELAESLTKLAVAMERSKRYIINKAIAKFIDDNLNDETDIFLAEEALKIEKECDGRHITWDEAEKRAQVIRVAEGLNV